ncbi:DUF4830 domain-containing protein [Caproiciproducens faecalis]|uniref:DUF4830 domain-containing protein n=1 Tax=Caproiciproducens faecalis TaxID=2820301 RepID=A0ABS7DN75_9FIRM|nr:DUF4830 domain-containing protein [Caproiciproducens faecalis]MBW7572745.1 DUF4830 domain-containing protein [Caproiciproducens faecalis]
MFILSIKAGRKKILIGLAAILLVVTAAIVVTKLFHSEPVASADGKKYSLSAGSNDQRVSFLKQFGWQVNTEPLEMKDVIIPAQFDDVYLQYNNIQKEQGLDLSQYAGKTCIQWVYAVTNYPGATDVRATLLVYDNRVIGGDLSTAQLDGFMTGFSGEKSSNDYSEPIQENPNAASTDPNAASAAPNTASAEPNDAAATAVSQIPANAWPTD